MTAMKDGKIGIGLIGTGFARSAQAPAFKVCEGAELVAVCSGRYENALKTAGEYSIPHPCETAEQLLAIPEVALVVVSAPPLHHHRLTLAAIEAGKHVICEKPMAMSTAQAREMYEKAIAHPGQLAIIDHEGTG
jgi:predicted dehydrogenase